MELNNRTIDIWLQNAPDDAYRHGKKQNYYASYIALKEYLEKNVHKQVTIGANLKDPDMLLNDHGTEHIETVIERATDLISHGECTLNALEVYILLLCIQLHDVGNIFGRYNHEMNIEKIMHEAESLCGRDHVEMITIRDIAQAHGGEKKGGFNPKDKISKLQVKSPLLDNEIRVQAIASILRFSDEIADDKRRAYTILLKEGKIPKKSEVYHAYAHCLDSVKINHDRRSIALMFYIPKAYATRSFGKYDRLEGVKDILLLDEIYNRVMKMHLERIYCMKFLKRIIEIDNISVEINFYDKSVDIFPKISFEISDLGYPIESVEGIYGLCRSLIDENGDKINGEYVKSRIIGVK